MQIDGWMRKEIRLGMLEAFPQLSDLRVFVEETLGEPLQNITLANDMQAVMFDLIVWAKARGRLTELVMGASADRPGNSNLIKLAERFRFVAAAPGENERIVLKTVPFQNVGQWVERMTLRKRAVGRFEPQAPLDESGYGSGFLVGPDVLGLDLSSRAKGAAKEAEGPFGKGAGRTPKQVENHPYFKQTYFAEGESYRRIEHTWLDAAGQFSLQLDGAINNTSLVIALELEGRAKCSCSPATPKWGVG